MKDEPFIRLAERMGKLPPYLFGTLNTMKIQRRQVGHDIIDLGMGNPTDPTPQVITDKLCQVAHDPKSHRYPVADGMKPIKAELALMYKRDYDVRLCPDTQVIMTIGSKEGISHLCLALTGPGDRVLVPSPYFPIHVYAAVIAGAEVLIRLFVSESQFLDDLVQCCYDEKNKPKLLLLNFPHNPTGRLVSQAFFVEIVRLAKRYGFMVIHDFAYSKIVFDGKKAPSFLEIPGAADVGVEFGSFSKAYNMAGWRIGYCAGNPEMIAALKRMKGYFDYGIFSAIQVAGIVALRHCDMDIQNQRQIYQERRDILCEGLNRMGWETPRPEAGMFVWTRIPERFITQEGLDSMGVSMKLLDQADVLVSPGSAFGPDGEGYLRIALVENKQRLRQALRQISRL